MKKYLFTLLTIFLFSVNSNSIYANEKEKEKEKEQTYKIIKNIENLNLELKQIKSNQIKFL